MLARRKFRLRSGWGGLSPESPLITELALKFAGDHYDMTGTNSRRGKVTTSVAMRVPKSDVMRLLEAMRKDPQSECSVRDFGISGRELEKQIESQFTELGKSEQFSDVTNELRAYRESLRRPDTLAAMLTTGSYPNRL